MSSQPDLILQLAHHVRDDFERRGLGPVEVHADAVASLNGRRLSALVDPEVDLATIDELAPIEDAMEKMRRCNCRHLPVMRGSHVVAFLSMRDLMNWELERKTEELHQMRAYIHGSA